MEKRGWVSALCLLALLCEPTFTSANPLFSFRSAQKDDTSEEKQKAEAIATDFCSRQLASVQDLALATVRSLLLAGDVWAEHGDVLLSQQCQADLEKLQISASSQIPTVSIGQTKLKKVDKVKPLWYRMVQRLFAHVAKHIHQSRLQYAFGGNEQPTTLQPWRPYLNRTGVQSTITALAQGLGYFVLLTTVGTFYVLHGREHDAEDSSPELKITTPAMTVLLCLAVVLAIVNYVAIYRSNITDMSVLEQDEQNLLRRTDTLVSMFVIGLWATVGCVAFFYADGVVDTSTFASFTIKVFGLMSVIKALSSVAISYAFQSPEEWRETLQFFVLRQLQSAQDTLQGMADPHGHTMSFVERARANPFLETDFLQGTLSHFLPDSCRTPSVGLECDEISGFLFAEHCDWHESPIFFRLVSDPVRLGNPVASVVATGSDSDGGSGDGLHIEIVLASGEHSTLSKRELAAVRAKWNLEKLVEVFAIGHLCRRTALASRAEFGDKLLEASTQLLSTLMALIGASSLVKTS